MEKNIFCPQCGSNNVSENTFCSECGTMLNQSKVPQIEHETITDNRDKRSKSRKKGMWIICTSFLVILCGALAVVLYHSKQIQNQEITKQSSSSLITSFSL